MNYLAAYNGKIRKIRDGLYEYLNDKYSNNEYNDVSMKYSRYDNFYEEFKIKLFATNIKVKEAEKGTISFSISAQGIQFEGKSRYYGRWKNIFSGLKNGFNNNSQYCDVKEKFLEVTDEDSLDNFLYQAYEVHTLKSELGKKLIAIFEETTMYKNLCEDYENFNKNYERIAKIRNYGRELFKIKFFSNGKIQMIYDEAGVEKKHFYDNPELLVAYGIKLSNCEGKAGFMLRGDINFRKYLQ